MSSRFRTFLVTALVPLLVSTPALALDEDDYKALSHVLAVGLPAVAGGISLAKGGAAGLYQLVLQRDKSTPFETPLLKWLGPWQFITFMGQLESGRVVPDALLFGMRVNFKPAQGLEIGLSRTAQWCGEGRPCDLGTFGNLLIGNDNNDATLSVADEPGNQLGGIDIRWAGSVMNRPGAVYGQMIGEDEAGGLPSRRFGMAGIETWGGGSTLARPGAPTWRSQTRPAACSATKPSTTWPTTTTPTKAAFAAGTKASATAPTTTARSRPSACCSVTATNVPGI